MEIGGVADAGRRFDDYVDRWQLDIDRALYRELKTAVLLPYRNERALLARLEVGRQVLDRHPEADWDSHLWQRWLAILAAWGACAETIEEDRQEQFTATEAVALKTVRRNTVQLLTRRDLR